MGSSELKRRLARLEGNSVTAGYLPVAVYPGLTEREANCLWFGPSCEPPASMKVIHVVNGLDLVCSHDRNLPDIPYDFAERRSHPLFTSYWNGVVAFFDKLRNEVAEAFGVTLAEFCADSRVPDNLNRLMPFDQGEVA